MKRVHTKDFPTPCTRCSADYFDEPHMHSDACRAQSDFARALDDVVAALITLTLSPAIFVLRVADLYIARRKGR